ncbi:MAG: hypothetical protein KF908_02305 [Nitrosomonas sp.]|nr:hypothetical protein [Nitrosomonas sp.]MCW5606831.1 hypothetical protein [Nitrosomonas sp.]
MSSDICIWCLQHANGKDEEHIIPEALGCPPGFVLPGTVVCRKCNNGLANLDSAVIDEFDFRAFMAGVPKKKGRPPAIRSRGNVVGTIEKDGSAISFNMDPVPVTAHDGSYLAPYRGSTRDVRAKFTRDGDTARISFDIPFGQNRKFLRGITKIAFSSLAYFLGAPLARSPAFSSVRRFVKHGAGNRHVLLTSSNDNCYSNSVWPPYISPSGDYAVTFRLTSVEFLVDLSEEESFIRMLQAKAPRFLGDKNWCTLPIKA